MWMLGPISCPALQKGSFEDSTPVETSSIYSGLTLQRLDNYSDDGEGSHKDTVVPGLQSDGC